MDSTRFNLGLSAIVVAMLFATASAQSSSCTSALINLSPCLNYITGNDSKPSSSCCSQLGSVVSSEPQCLCMVLNGGSSSLGININQTQALALPGACNVKTPPASKCNSNGGGPSSSPNTPSSSSPSVPSVPSDSGSKTIPGVGSSDGSSLQIPFSVLFSVIPIVAYVSAASNIF
ncbi:uncharacterized protein A4U43_C03F5220 [Asparagus officinalis]|uniref:Bifunctional inhibitor/plant lipid transfer protein/seed storage helical domain-containing protein n=1 Tax=Asparagus officinalis TaxID=4686 RepID=A0A5P1FBX4_ASPOF|nr:non-specific lipid-transfer protein-like protein At2g13820 [Asparagus officinalis]ONK74339.1 uncharacterized protein A4U43_C03F5220 [Asparagus officinalis]